MRWLRTRIDSIFLRETHASPLMIKIQLDNKDQYDELALSSAISHIKAVQSFYENVENRSEFMRDYCQNLNT